MTGRRPTGCSPAIPVSTFYVLIYNSFFSVPSSVLAPTAPVVETPSSNRSWWPVVSLTLALGALWFVCCWHLSAEWSYNEQYSYGWFVPFFALYLFWLRWEDRPRPWTAAEIRNPKSEIRNSIAVVIAIGALLLLLPIRLIEVANPDWRPISWLHTLVAVSLTLLVIW